MLSLFFSVTHLFSVVAYFLSLQGLRWLLLLPKQLILIRLHQNICSKLIFVCPQVECLHLENIVVAYLSLDLQSHYPLIIFQNFRGFTFYTGRSNFYELIFRFLFECFLLVIIINIDPRFIVASLSIGVESVKIIPNLFDQSMNTAFPCDGLPVVLYFLYDNDHSVI